MLETLWNNGGSFLIASLVFFFFGSMLLYLGLRSYLMQRKLYKVGIPAKATIIAFQSGLSVVERNDITYRKVTYTIRLKYKNRGHDIYTTDDFLYKKASIKNVDVGDEIDILYDPDDGKKILITDERIVNAVDKSVIKTMFLIFCGFGICLYLSALWLIFLGIKSLFVFFL